MNEIDNQTKAAVQIQVIYDYTDRTGERDTLTLAGDAEKVHAKAKRIIKGMGGTKAKLRREVRK